MYHNRVRSRKDDQFLLYGYISGEQIEAIVPVLGLKVCIPIPCADDKTVIVSIVDRCGLQVMTVDGVVKLKEETDSEMIVFFVEVLNRQVVCICPVPFEDDDWDRIPIYVKKSGLREHSHKENE